MSRKSEHHSINWNRWVSDVSNELNNNMKKRTLKLIITALAMVLGFQSFGKASEFDHSHHLLNQVLKRHVGDALVDYSALKSSSRELATYLNQLANVSEARFQRWTESQQIAFLLNAYNAYTLRLIIDHYPVRSIKKIGGFFSGPWDQKIVQLFGKTITLKALEHDMLRKNYREPRIHFAMVCAALGCPPLRAEAYRGDNLREQLIDQARTFLSNHQKNRVDVGQRIVYLSPIFKWFADDFEKESGTVLNFLRPYFPKAVQTELAKGNFRTRYTDYDWLLNDAKGR